MPDARARCVAACEHCATACLGEGDAKTDGAPHPPRPQLRRHLPPHCRLTAAFVARGSGHAKHVLKKRIETSQKCRDERAQHQHQHCQECAAACKACLEA